MENEKTLEELKQQCMQQYDLTEEQLDNALAALNKVWEVVKEFLDRALSAFQELAEAIKAAAQSIEREQAQKFAQEYAESPDTAADLAAALERLQNLMAAAGAYIYDSSPPYDRADTRNAQYNAKLKSYKNKICSAAIRKPRGVARSCC